MVNQLRRNGILGAAMAGMFTLVIIGSAAAIAVPAWSQTPTQEEELAAIEAERQPGPRARFGVLAPREGMAKAQSRRAGMPGAPLAARRGHMGIGGGRFDLASRALGRAEEIGLTDAQKEQIEAERDTYRRQQIERDASLKLVALDLTELLQDDGSDLNAVEQKMREAADLRVQEQIAALRYRRDVQGVLTAEQIEQLRELAADFTRHRTPTERSRRQR